MLAIIFGIAAVCNSCGVVLSPETISSNTAESAMKETASQSSETESAEAAATVTAGSNEKYIETSEDISTVIWSGASRGLNKIALTFDSGWEFENTEALLDILDEYDVKSTFFTRGMWVSDHAELAREIVTRGHDLENHSLNHGHMTEMTDDEVVNEIRGATDIILQKTGYLPMLFRPPYGEYDDRILMILKAEGYSYTVMWSVDSHDWAEELNGIKITKSYIIKRVLDNASDGGIILMHIGGYNTVDALPEIITGLRAKGYEIVKIDDML